MPTSTEASWLNASKLSPDVSTLFRTRRTGNAAPRNPGNGGSNPIGDLIVVELPRYQAEERIAIQEIHQQLDVRFLGNFTAILCRLKRDRGESLTSRRDRASYAQARAQLVQASSQISLVEAQLAQAQAQLDSSKANSDYLQRTFERNSQLFYQGRGVISKQDLDTAQSQAEISVATDKANLAAVNVARENVKVAHAQEEAARAQAQAALAQVKSSELQLSYCTIFAPVSGRIAEKTVQTGNHVLVGQDLMAVVEDDVWILANLKETQLERERSRSGNRSRSKSTHSHTTGSQVGSTVCNRVPARISPCFPRTMPPGISLRSSNAYL